MYQINIKIPYKNSILGKPHINIFNMLVLYITKFIKFYKGKQMCAFCLYSNAGRNETKNLQATTKISDNINKQNFMTSSKIKNIHWGDKLEHVTNSKTGAVNL